MPFFIVHADITKMKVDAIVNATDNNFSGGGGVDYAINHASGEKLKKECAVLRSLDTGDAKITNAYNLPCKKVIHTVGPIWRGGQNDEENLLVSCYKKSLELAKQNNLKSIAFPLISAGVYGYPKDQALNIAVDTIKEFIFQEDMNVYLVVYTKELFMLSKTLFDDVSEYLDNNYTNRLQLKDFKKKKTKQTDINFCQTNLDSIDEMPSYSIDKRREGILLAHSLHPCNLESLESLDDTTKDLDESFSEMLFRLIDEKGITDVECYKRANIDRKLFSKIKSKKDYRPSKTTAVAFAIALELPFDKAKTLIEYAGYSLTHNNKFDVIIEYFIKKKIYDIFTINETLFEFDQKLLGN